MRKVCRVDMHLPPALILPFIRLGARLFGHFDLREADAVRAVKNTSIPILLLHGEDDRFVPCEMSREICAACAGDITCVTFPNAGHGLSYIIDTEKYKNEVARFIDRCLQSFGGGQLRRDLL